LTLSVSDEAVQSGDRVYTVASSGLGEQVTTASSGSWTDAFTGDPEAFVVLRGAPLSLSSSTFTTTSTQTQSTGTRTTRRPVALMQIASLGARRLHDGKLKLQARTRNGGHADSPVTWTAFYLRAQRRRHQLVQLARRRVGRLRPGREAAQDAVAAIPRRLGNGSWRVTACADVTHRVSRSSHCASSRLVVMVRTRHHRHRFVTVSYALPLSPPRIAVLAPFTPGSGGHFTPILLLLAGFGLLTFGTASLGLRGRPSAAA
ncbi:MAG: hypothetical protein ACRDL5_17720, partial [Solirubrobacteraceae bacterium]